LFVIIFKRLLIWLGIGAAVAKSFVHAGCSRIAITDVNPKTLDQTKNAILEIDPSAQVFSKAGDIADEKFVDSFNDETFSRFSRLDYAVNCAGILGGNTIKAVEMTTDAFDRLNDINYKGSWLSCRAQLRNMLKQEPLEDHPKQRGSIVNIARPGAGELVIAKSLRASRPNRSQLRTAHRRPPSST
jgi:NAD(P)-dependent dehydrogenase (short-subunit alcohol dehydrogenase family)